MPAASGYLERVADRRSPSIHPRSRRPMRGRGDVFPGSELITCPVHRRDRSVSTRAEPRARTTHAREGCRIGCDRRADDDVSRHRPRSTRPAPPWPACRPTAPVCATSYSAPARHAVELRSARRRFAGHAARRNAMGCRAARAPGSPRRVERDRSERRSTREAGRARSAPTTAMSWPSTTRDDDFNTSIAFLRNCPAPGDTLTPGAEPIQTANGRELSAANSSGSSSTVPASQPRSGGDACTVELEPDELAGDNVRHFAVWIGPAPGVSVSPSRRAVRQERVRRVAHVASASTDGHDIAVVGGRRAVDASRR